MQNYQNTDYSGLKELIDIEVMQNYNKSIVNNAICEIGLPLKFMDFGSGIGTLDLIFRQRYNLNPICIEIDSANCNYLKKRGFKYMNSLKEAGFEYDVIFSSNVLEHIQEDTKILSEMKDHLKSKGLIYLYLPAFMSLWSEIDKQVGHYRRYNIADLKEKCKKSGYKVIKIHYADCLGFFITLLWKLKNNNNKNKFASRNSLKIYDKYIFPISNFLDNLGFKFLFGKNIVLLAQK